MNRSLYHFTSYENFYKYILPSKELKLNKLINSNDPYEYMHMKYTQFGSKIEKEFAIQNMNKLLIQIKSFKENSQVCCFVTPEIKKSFVRFGYDRLRMWDQYGKKHTGVCLALNKKNLEDSFNKLPYKSLYARKTIYKDLTGGSVDFKEMSKPSLREKLQRAVIDKIDADKFIKNNINRIFFTKDIDYKFEREFRLLFLCNDNIEDQKINIQNSITDIFFGDRIDSISINLYLPLITKAFTNLSQICQVSWSNGQIYKKIYHQSPLKPFNDI